jgi:hypothetical protein
MRVEIKPEIEKVPLPSRFGSSKRAKPRTKIVLPFGEMEVGDSFFIPKEQKKPTTIAARASEYGKKHDKRFTTKFDEEGCRVWRVE